MVGRVTKMHVCGNEFLVAACADGDELWRHRRELAVHACDRAHWPGADELVLLRPTGASEARLAVYNPDGSEAPLCVTRCSRPLAT